MVACMNEITVRRTFSLPPHRVWPSLADLACWLEPGLRWRIDETDSEAGRRLVARVWDQPGSSSLITIELDGDDLGGSVVTIVQQRDRHFRVDASLTDQTMVAT